MLCAYVSLWPVKKFYNCVKFLYKLSARVKLSSDGGKASKAPAARLRALGFDPYGRQKADAEASVSESGGNYVRREVYFTAGNPWVVISLEHNGSGCAYWDDVTLEEVSSCS